MSRAFVLISLLVATSSFADDYDFRIAQLGNPLMDMADNPVSDAAFRTFTRQMAAALSSSNLSPPETLGHAAFNIQLEGAFVDFGTSAKMPTIAKFNGGFRMWSVHFRKGLPASFELGARATWIEKSRMGGGMLELKWALNEGFKYLPDIGVRASVSKLMNSRDFDMTVGGLDVAIGKQFALAGMMTITPYAGWNLQFVGANTGSVDFNPSRTLAESDAAGQQYSNFFVYQSVTADRNIQNRFFGGLRFIGGVFQLIGEISYTILGRFRQGNTDFDMPNVLTGSVGMGLDF